MSSEVIEELQRSADPLERELGAALLKWQDERSSQGLSRSLGYEPRDIRKKGAVAVIETRVLNASSGFEEIDMDSSYEAIVDRHPDRFSDAVVTAARSRLQNSQRRSVRITSDDLHLIASSRSKQRYTDLSDAEHEAYAKISNALQALGELLKSRFTDSSKFEVRTTSGFTISSGVRSYIPKDLWFSVSPKQNAKDLAGMPQLFMIVSERGIEYGFGASVSPSDFSQKSVKEIVRRAAPAVFDQLPAADSSESTSIQHDLEASGTWYYRRKHRLPPNQREFHSFKEWLRYLQSSEGKRNAAGTISRYLLPDDLNGRSLDDEIFEMARLFEPLIDRDWYVSAGNDEQGHTSAPDLLRQEEEKVDVSNEFGNRLSEFLRCYGEKRSGPFTVDDELGTAMRNLQDWLERAPAMAGRPTVKVRISVGQGGWTKTPWIALLDDRETTSTQRGRYIVFLIAEDLSTTYLTLNQGMTDLVGRHGQRGAISEMHNVAEIARRQLPELSSWGFTIGADIDLHSETTAARNYEEGTIAYVELPSERLPNDSTINAYLASLLWGYDRLIVSGEMLPDEQSEELSQVIEEPYLEPYGIDDALTELFLEREDVERYLEIWRHKKNLILQGAPGVGKSFIARRLAYTLIGFKDDTRVQTVQFHQSYSYEDFVQGYRPNGNQGFERKNGTFYEFRDRALRDPDGKYVFIIDEINRGNLSKIFGELMLLIEPDKRGPTWKTRLAYATDGDPDFYLPKNLYILGMMNTADRSLSLVDYALRRRFAFVAMEPLFGAPKFRTHLEAHEIPNEVVTKIVNVMGELNQAIEMDRTNLGPGFRIGHSFFTPTEAVRNPEAWYRRVVETEIHPLLEEYWFDAPETADQWRDQLLR